MDSNPSDVSKLVNAVDGLRGSVEVMTADYSKLLDILKEFLSVQKEINEETKGTNANVEDFVEEADRAKRTFKELVGYTKKFKFDLGTKSIKESKAFFKSLIADTQHLMKTTKATSEQTLIYAKTIRMCNEAMTVLERHTGSQNDLLKSQVGILKEMNKQVAGLEDNFSKMSETIGGLKLGKLNKAVLGVRSMFGQHGHPERITNKARDLRDMHQTRQEKVKANKEIFEAKRGAALDEIKAKHPDLFDDKGVLNQEKFRKSKEAQSLAADYILGPNGSKKNKQLFGGILQSEGGAGMFAGDPKAKSSLYNYAAAGAGSVTEGKAGSMLASVAGMGADLLEGPAGMVVAGGLMAKDAFDAVANQNKEYETVLGKAGVFTGDMSTTEALRNVANNLRNSGLNRYGITTERQLKVAGAMGESGFNVSGIATDGTGFGGGGIGEISDIAFKQARAIGLTDVESVKQTLKLMQNYKMNLDGTQHFFQTIGRDIRTSGISTASYLQLIDDITGQFDSMGKSIGTVTSILRVLGSTGTQTAEQMKDTVSSLIGGEKTTPQRAILLTMLGKKGVSELHDSLEQGAHGASDTFISALNNAINELPEGSRAGITAGLGDLSTLTQQEEALRRYKSAHVGGVGTPKSMILESLLMQSQSARVNADSLKNGNLINAAFMPDIVAMPASQKMAMQLQALKSTLGTGGKSLSDFLNDATTLDNGMMAALVSGVGGTLGLDDKKKTLNMRQGVNNIADVIADELHRGLTEGTQASMKPGEEEKMYADALEHAGIGRDKNVSAKTQYMKLDQNGKDFSKIREGIRDSFNDVTKIVATLDPNNPINKSLTDRNVESLSAIMDKAAGLSIATRTSSDILDGIRKAITSEISRPLLGIEDWLMKIFPNEDAQISHDATNALYDPNTVLDASLLADAATINPTLKDPNLSDGLAGKDIATLKKEFSDLSPSIENKTADKNQQNRFTLLVAAIHKFAEDIKERKFQGINYDPQTGLLKLPVPVTANPVAQNVVNPPATEPKTGKPVKAGDTTIQNITNMTSVASISYLQTNLAKNNGSIPYPHQKNRDVPTVPGGG